LAIPTCKKSNSQFGESSKSNFVKFNCSTFVVLVVMRHAQFTLWPYSMLPECGYRSVPDKPNRLPPQPAETKEEEESRSIRLDEDNGFRVTGADINKHMHTQARVWKEED
jgi:hypothetical protein